MCRASSGEGLITPRYGPRHVALGLIVVGLGIALYAISLPLRASAQKKSCQSNLKQIGLATMQYVRDYDELFMLAPKWKTELDPYGKFYRQPNFAPVYICPTTGRQYAFNAALSGAMITLVKSPPTMAMFYEPARAINADSGHNWAAEGIHGEGSNVCFHDGHVAWLKAKPTFWVPELADKEGALHRRDEDFRRMMAALNAKRRQEKAEFQAARRKQAKKR
ncbi:hypothetical protein IAD21_01562 [Abditibacteriota bacterium]|nr:hypothetical protein IAD21_01562 [Abditibacteriota bacterium]